MLRCFNYLTIWGYSIYNPYSSVSICQWGFTLGKERMVEQCFLEMVSSYLRNHMVPLVPDHQPKKASVVKPHVEPTQTLGRDPLAIQKGVI